ncbi:hypothetical protein HOLleu_29924 [Holothuria leucospilota]|uniref:Uncharacterized protein n=1 Tax=Holothuria leucospilota TaxID=206669 RepID=A0A9Q1GW64_HOLLE|nr:hypothetical protein HOLleu_29924 [Holothuria leucospilota]
MEVEMGRGRDGAIECQSHGYKISSSNPAANRDLLVWYKAFGNDAVGCFIGFVRVSRCEILVSICFAPLSCFEQACQGFCETTSIKNWPNLASSAGAKMLLLNFLTVTLCIKG